MHTGEGNSPYQTNEGAKTAFVRPMTEQRAWGMGGQKGGGLGGVWGGKWNVEVKGGESGGGGVTKQAPGELKRR